MSDPNAYPPPEQSRFVNKDKQLDDAIRYIHTRHFPNTEFQSALATLELLDERLSQLTNQKPQTEPEGNTPE